MTIVIKIESTKLTFVCFSFSWVSRSYIN